MKIIYKHSIQVGTLTLNLPNDAEFLTAQIKDNCIYAWVRHSAHTSNYTAFRINVIGTGWEHSQEGTYLDTVITADGYVWHVFYEKL
jgi:hypothetical protein